MYQGASRSEITALIGIVRLFPATTDVADICVASCRRTLHNTETIDVTERGKTQMLHRIPARNVGKYKFSGRRCAAVRKAR